MEKRFITSETEYCSIIMQVCYLVRLLVLMLYVPVSLEPPTL